LESFSVLRQVEDEEGEAPLEVPKAEKGGWERLLRLLGAVGWRRGWEWPLVVLRGPKGVGKHRRARALAKMAGYQRILSVDVDALRASRRGDVLGGLRVVMREAALQGAIPCLYGWEGWLQAHPTGGGDEGGGGMSDTTHAQASWARVLDQVLSQYASPLILFAEAKDVAAPALRGRATELLDLLIPSSVERCAFWERALPAAQRAEGFDLEGLAAAFQLTPGQIAVAVDAARSAADDGRSGEVTLSQRQVISTIKEHIKHRLGDQAHLVENRYQWSDLVVGPEVGVQLRELISRYRHRARVLEQWGLGKRFGEDLGLSALFEGPPGTGKTMAASMIASELNLDLYQIDLSKVVNRYIGETEKNLGRIFDEAERSQGMLLFDEADSLFGSRTEVKSSNDRYANLEVNYLLQRIERFSGVAILTTNFPAGIDEAFSRRLSMRVSFIKPDATERKRLWRSMLREADLPKGPIDYEDLAAEFEMAGGHIRNAVLRAAFIAASRNRVVDHDLLALAARIEMKEQGMLVHGNPLHELAEEISQP
jgi:AAA+ superfamily predicted ATPase